MNESMRRADGRIDQICAQITITASDEAVTAQFLGGARLSAEITHSAVRVTSAR